MSTKGKLLITGTARSGTLYTATVLNEAGYDVAHERRRLSDRKRKQSPLRGPNWETEIDVSWLGAWWLPEPGSLVVHQTRDPRKSIASMFDRKMARPNHARRFNTWLLECMPSIDQEPTLLDEICRYWALWNRMIEPYAKMRVKVEDMDAVQLNDVLTLAGYEPNVHELEVAIKSVAKNTNTTKWLDPNNRTTFEWDDLPDYVVELGKEYDYA